MQKHLFDDHRAETLDEYFVKINSSCTPGGLLYICVVCWAKITSLPDTANHRNVCKISSPEQTNGGSAGKHDLVFNVTTCLK